MIPHAIRGSRCRRRARVAVSGVVGGCDSIPSLAVIRCHLDGMAWHGVAASVQCGGATVCREGGVATVFSSHDSTLRPYRGILIASMHQQHYLLYPTCSPHLHAQYNHTHSATPMPTDRHHHAQTDNTSTATPCTTHEDRALGPAASHHCTIHTSSRAAHCNHLPKRAPERRRRCC